MGEWEETESKRISLLRGELEAEEEEEQQQQQERQQGTTADQPAEPTDLPTPASEQQSSILSSGPDPLQSKSLKGTREGE